MNASRVKRQLSVKVGCKGRPFSSARSGAPYMKMPRESQIAAAQIVARTIAVQGRCSEPRIASESGDGKEATNAIARIARANLALRPLRET